MHITTPDHEYQRANPFPMKDDRMQNRIKKNSFKRVAVLIQLFTLKLSINLNFTVCIFASFLL